MLQWLEVESYITVDISVTLTWYFLDVAKYLYSLYFM